MTDQPDIARIPVSGDPRDLPGTFPHRYVVETRFGDTDAMGHINNSRFLTFCESARIAYWEAATGEPFGLVTHGAEESLILADVRVTFRSPSYFGEVLTVESRMGGSGGRRSPWSTGSRRPTRRAAGRGWLQRPRTCWSSTTTRRSGRGSSRTTTLARLEAFEGARSGAESGSPPATNQVRTGDPAAT